MHSTYHKCCAVPESASRINGRDYVVTLCAREGRASVLRAVGKLREAHDEMEIVVPMLLRSNLFVFVCVWAFVGCFFSLP